MGKGEYLHRGHTVTDIKYHFVWVTKDRYQVRDGVVAWGGRLYPAVRAGDTVAGERVYGFRKAPVMDCR